MQGLPTDFGFSQIVFFFCRRAIYILPLVVEGRVDGSGTGSMVVSAEMRYPGRPLTCRNIFPMYSPNSPININSILLKNSTTTIRDDQPGTVLPTIVCI